MSSEYEEFVDAEEPMVDDVPDVKEEPKTTIHEESPLAKIENKSLNYSHNVPVGTEGHRFRMPTNRHMMIVGPTQAGKTSFVKKMLIDGFEHPLGTAPFQKVFYVGLQGESDSIVTGTQTMNWTYAKIEPGTANSIPDTWISVGDIDKLGSIIKSPENKNLKKLIIIDDALKNKSDSIAKYLFSLVGEGQHDNAAYIVIGHSVAGFKDLKSQCSVRVLIKNNDPADYRNFFINKPGDFYSKMIQKLQALKDEDNSLTRHIVVYSVLEHTFYDYNFNLFV